MTDTTLNRDELILAHRLWISPLLRLSPGAAHAFLESCTDTELETVASMQSVADKRTKRDTVKTIYNIVSERSMVRDPVPLAAPTPDSEAPAAEPAVDEPKPTRRTKRDTAE